MGKLKWYNKLSQNVVTLSIASLLNSISSEMLAVVLPIYMAAGLKLSHTTIGATDGIAAIFSCLIKLSSGAIVDHFQCYLLFTGMGYFFAAIARVSLLVLPKLLHTALPWTVVVFSKALEKIGKGLRSAPRDTLLTFSVHPSTRGLNFSLHHLAQIVGCVISLLLALTLILFFGTNKNSVADQVNSDDDNVDHIWELILLSSIPFGFISVIIISIFGQGREVALQGLIDMDKKIHLDEQEHLLLKGSPHISPNQTNLGYQQQDKLDVDRDGALRTDFNVGNISNTNVTTDSGNNDDVLMLGLSKSNENEQNEQNSNKINISFTTPQQSTSFQYNKTHQNKPNQTTSQTQMSNHTMLSNIREDSELTPTVSPSSPSVGRDGMFKNQADAVKNLSDTHKVDGNVIINDLNNNIDDNKSSAPHTIDLNNSKTAGNNDGTKTELNITTIASTPSTIPTTQSNTSTNCECDEICAGCDDSGNVVDVGKRHDSGSDDNSDENNVIPSFTYQLITPPVSYHTSTMNHLSNSNTNFATPLASRQGSDVDNKNNKNDHNNNENQHTDNNNNNNNLNTSSTNPTQTYQQHSKNTAKSHMEKMLWPCSETSTEYPGSTDSYYHSNLDHYTTLDRFHPHHDDNHHHNHHTGQSIQYHHAQRQLYRQHVAFADSFVKGFVTNFLPPEVKDQLKLQHGYELGDLHHQYETGDIGGANHIDKIDEEENLSLDLNSLLTDDPNNISKSIHTTTNHLGTIDDEIEKIRKENDDADRNNSNVLRGADAVVDATSPNQLQSSPSIQLSPLPRYPLHKITNIMALRCDCEDHSLLIEQLLANYKEESLFGNTIVPSDDNYYPLSPGDAENSMNLSLKTEDKHLLPRISHRRQHHHDGDGKDHHTTSDDDDYDDDDDDDDENVFDDTKPTGFESEPLLEEYSHRKRLYRLKKRQQLAGKGPFATTWNTIKNYAVRAKRAIIKGIKHNYLPELYPVYNREERRRTRHILRLKKQIYFILVDRTHKPNCMYAYHQKWLIEQNRQLNPGLYSPNDDAYVGGTTPITPDTVPMTPQKKPNSNYNTFSSQLNGNTPLRHSTTSNTGTGVTPAHGGVNASRMKRKELKAKYNKTKQMVNAAASKAMLHDPTRGVISYSQLIRSVRDKEKKRVKFERTKLIMSLISIICFGQMFTIPHTFLILLAHNQQLSIEFIVSVVLLFNIVYSAFTTPAGILSDKLRKQGGGGGAFTVMVGWTLRALIFFFLAYNIVDGSSGKHNNDPLTPAGAVNVTATTTTIIVGFIFLGFYMAFTEGTIKALIVDVMPPQLKSSLKKKKNGRDLLRLLHQEQLNQQQQQQKQLNGGYVDPLNNNNNNNNNTSNNIDKNPLVTSPPTQKELNTEHNEHHHHGHHHHHHHHDQHGDSSLIGIAFGMFDAMLGLSEFSSSMIAGAFFDKNAVALWLCFNSIGSLLSSCLLFYWRYKIASDPFTLNLINQLQPNQDKKALLGSQVNGIFIDFTALTNDLGSSKWNWGNNSYGRGGLHNSNGVAAITPDIITTSEKSILVDVCILTKETAEASSSLGLLQGDIKHQIEQQIEQQQFDMGNVTLLNNNNNNGDESLQANNTNNTLIIRALAVVRPLLIPTKILIQQLGREPSKEDLTALSHAAYTIANCFNQSYANIAYDYGISGYAGNIVDFFNRIDFFSMIPPNVLRTPGIICYENESSSQRDRHHHHHHHGLYGEHYNKENDNSYCVLLIGVEHSTFQRRQARSGLHHTRRPRH